MGVPMQTNTHARTTDPLSSHLAALDNSSRRDAQVGVCVALVCRHPGLTSMELASRGDVCRYMLARRLSDAAKRGMVVKGPQKHCDVSGKLAMSWDPSLDD